MNAITYFIRRLKLDVRRHEVFLSLGYNCELSYRYYCRNRFVDSGLFQWAGSSLDDMIRTLEHLDELYAGKIEDPIPRNPLYHCLNTHVRSHGKAPVSLWQGPETDENRALRQADRDEFIGRMTHLKEKFVRTLNAGGAVVMYKIRSDDMMRDDAAPRIERMVEALRKLGARDFDFVLVCEEKCRGRAFSIAYDRFFTRYVSAFNPNDRVATRKIGDTYGWRLLFDEFRPLHRKKKSHRYKFENEKE